MCRVLFIFLIVLISSPVLSHQDRIIRLDENGVLIGLPENYIPAAINLSSYSISIASTAVTLPNCISDYFSPSNYSLYLIASSWYHDLDLLPPYIDFKFRANDSNTEFNLLLSLEDLSVIQLTKITSSVPNTWQRQDIELSESCLLELQGSYE